jgi:hypothetical protein
MANHHYTSILRLPFLHVEKSLDLLAFLKNNRHTFDSVFFFINPTHDILSIKHMAENIERVLPVIAEVKQLGFQTGINNLNTLGHHAEDPDPEMEDMDFKIREDGSKARGTLCPTSEKTLRYITELYTRIARTGVDFVYSDDDLDYNANCFCDHCLEKFGVKTREELLSRFSSDDEDIRRKTREQWLGFYREKLSVIYGTIEKAVHGVHAGITLGFMPCTVGSNGSGADEWAERLRGSSEKILCRPGGGLYSDLVPGRVMEKANAIGRQIRYLPEWAEAQAEIECFPVQSLRKGARFTGQEILTYLAAGCTGTAWSVSSPPECSFTDAARYYRLAEQLKPFADTLTDTFGRGVSYGIGSYWDRDSAANPSEKQWKANLYTEDELYNIGLPICYDNQAVSVYLLNGAGAANLTDDQIMTHLKTAVFMDAEAADILNRRGFGTFVGFAKADRFTKNVCEQTLEHALTEGLAGNIRNIHLEFSLNGHPEFGKARPVYTIVRTNEKALYLSELKSYLGKVYGYGSGIFENELGGRVCVGGYAPFDWCYTMGRTRELKNIFVWLSRNTMGAYVKSAEKIALWNRKTSDGRQGVVLSNISLDPVRDLEIALKTSSITAEASIFDGEQTIEYKCAIMASGVNGYGTVTIPLFPAQTVGFIVY